MSPNRVPTQEELRLKEKYSGLPPVHVTWISLPDPNDLQMPAGDYILQDDIARIAEEWDSDEIRLLAVCLNWKVDA